MFFNRKPEPQPVYTPVQPPEEEIAEVLPKVKQAPINTTVIGEGITFYGDFETEEPMEINGHVLGNIISTTSIEISATGTYKGDAKMENLILSGTADGNIDCGDLTKLTGTGNMVGNLSTARLITEDGSNFGGKLSLDSAKGKKAEDISDAPADDFEKLLKTNSDALAEENRGTAQTQADAVFEAAEAVFSPREEDVPADEGFIFGNN